MSKLYSLKPWYSIEEAAARLTASLKEPVSTVEVIQFASEGLLCPSWYLRNPSFVRKVAVYCSIPEGGATEYWTHAVPIERYGVDGSGLYRMRVDLWGPYRQFLLTFAGWGYDSGNMTGPIIEDANGDLWEIYDPQGNDVFMRPERSEVVFQRSDMEDFEASLPGAPPSGSSPQSKRAENVLLRLVATLADMNKLDLSKPSKAASVIAAHSQTLGSSIGEDTIAKRLKEASALLAVDPN